MSTYAFVLSIITYFLAAIPFGLLISNLKGIDLRKVGSGNIGATNVYRALGVKYAVGVFFLDGFKGWLPTFLSVIFIDATWIHVCIGFIAIAGHSLSLFVKFKGGKGAATGIGVICALSPIICLIIVITAILIIYLTRYVSLATILCSILTPILFYLQGYPISYITFLCLICLFIIIRHKSNLARLLKGKENKI